MTEILSIRQPNPEEGGGAPVVSELPNLSGVQPGASYYLSSDGHIYAANLVLQRWEQLYIVDQVVTFIPTHWADLGSGVYALTIIRGDDEYCHQKEVITQVSVYRKRDVVMYEAVNIYHNINNGTGEIYIEGAGGDIPFAGRVIVSGY
jgi:hypothetical protein